MVNFGLLDEETKGLLSHVARYQNYINQLDIYRIAREFLTETYAKNDYKIVLHGGGEHTRKLLDGASSLLLEHIVAITDNAKVDDPISNFRISLVDVLKTLEYDFVVMSSDINQKPMFEELSTIGVSAEKIIDIYTDKYFYECVLNKPDEKDKVDQLLQKVNSSANPLLVLSDSMSLTHLKLFKFLGRHYDLFVATPDHSICSSKIDLSNDDFSYFYQFGLSADLIFLASEITKGKILTINGIFRNSFGACISVVAKVDVFSMFIDIIGTAFKDIEVLNKVCNAKIELFSEKLLWENSAGVIFKESIELAMPNIEKYRPKKYIRFFDYCDDDIVLPKRSVGNVNPAFVYAGGLVSMSRQDHAASLQTSIADVANLLIKNNCRFGIFNAYDNGMDDGFDVYKNISYSNLFSYSKGVPLGQLYAKLREYDVGVILFDFSRVLDRYDFDYFKFGSSTKVISYIEAELPIVVSKESESMAAIVEDNEIGVAIYWHEIDKLPHMFTQEKLTKYRDNIKNLKESLSYSKNIVRLVEFMDSCH